MLLIIILLIILVLIYLKDIESFENGGGSSGDIIIPESHIDNIYELTRYMHDFLTRHVIPYWLIGGSLIGALRNTPPGPIKWDDDVDVAILKYSETLLKRAINDDVEFNSKVSWAPTCFGYQFKLKGHDEGYKDYYYDIFIYEEKEHGAWYTPFFDKFYYKDISEILPLQKCKFWDMELWAPNDLMTVHRGYDCDVLKFAQKYNHRTKSSVKTDITTNTNNGDTIPLVSANIAKKLHFM